MSSSIEDSLSAAIEEIRSNDPELGQKGVLIVQKNGNDAAFFQYSVDTDGWMLDFPLGPENSSDQADKIIDIVEDKAEEIREPEEIGGIFQADLDPEEDIKSISSQIITTIWPDCTSIETEVVR